MLSMVPKFSLQMAGIADIYIVFASTDQTQKQRELRRLLLKAISLDFQLAKKKTSLVFVHHQQQKLSLKTVSFL